MTPGLPDSRRDREMREETAHTPRADMSHVQGRRAVKRNEFAEGCASSSTAPARGGRRETRESRDLPVLRVGLAAARGTAALHLNDLKSELRTFAVTGHVPGTDGCRRCAARSSVGERAQLHTDEGKLWRNQRIGPRPYDIEGRGPSVTEGRRPSTEG